MGSLIRFAIKRFVAKNHDTFGVFAVQPFNRHCFPIFKWHQSLFWLLRSIYLEKHGSYKAEVARVPTLVEDHGWEARLLTSCRFTGQITTAGNRGGSYLGNGQLIAGEKGNSEMVNIHDKQVCWMCGKYFSQSQSMRRGCVVCSCFLPWVRRIYIYNSRGSGRSQIDIPIDSQIVGQNDKMHRLMIHLNNLITKTLGSTWELWYTHNMYMNIYIYMWCMYQIWLILYWHDWSVHPGTLKCSHQK